MSKIPPAPTTDNHLNNNQNRYFTRNFSKVYKPPIIKSNIHPTILKLPESQIPLLNSNNNDNNGFDPKINTKITNDGCNTQYNSNYSLIQQPPIPDNITDASKMNSASNYFPVFPPNATEPPPPPPPPPAAVFSPFAPYKVGMCTEQITNTDKQMNPVVNNSIDYSLPQEQNHEKMIENTPNVFHNVYNNAASLTGNNNNNTNNNTSNNININKIADNNPYLNNMLNQPNTIHHLPNNLPNNSQYNSASPFFPNNS